VAAAFGVVSAIVAMTAQLWLGGSGPLYFEGTRPALGLLILAIIGAALANSVGEELFWRGMLVRAARPTDIRVQWAIQAGSFGLAHMFGIPSGPVGVVFASLFSVFLFALLRRYGLFVAWIAHFVTDLVLFALVVITGSFAFSFGG
jgi:membrane protease YdiL (CAAX protease family)